MGTCGAGLIKWALIAINLALLIIGGLVSYIGGKLVGFNNISDAAKHFADIDFKMISWIVLIVGIVILLIAALGFFGSCCNSSFMLNLYGILLIVLIAGEIYVVVKANKSGENLDEKIDQGFNKAMDEMKNNSQTFIFVQQMQATLKCCGWNNSTDYRDKDLPASCCGEWKPTDDPDKLCVHADKVYNKGCKSIIKDVEKYFGNSKTTGIVAILVQVILILAAFCLARDV